MLNIGNNLIVLIVCWVLTTSAGIYMTFIRQPEELKLIEKAEEVARLKQTEVSSLLAEASASEDMAASAVSRWNARYKLLPENLTSPDVIGYLNSLTQEGFENFDVSFDGVQQTADYRSSTFQVKGRAYYGNLYRLIWKLENGRRLFRVRDLYLEHVDLIDRDKEADADRMQVLVSFTMLIDAYYGGTEGISAPDLASDMPPVPGHVLPAENPAINPFFPVILSQLPPNTHKLIDLEEAALVAILGDKAVFLDKEGYRKVGAGDDVYLGRIVSVNPAEGRVVAQRNQGGIIDEIEIKLNTGEPFRQAQGPVRLAPSAE